MDLPNDTPAGSRIAPAFAGEDGVLPTGDQALTRENDAAASIGVVAASTHACDGDCIGAGEQKKSSGWRSIPGFPFVLQRMGWGTPHRVSNDDSTKNDLGRRETRVQTSPDAQGRTTKMIKRNL